MSDFTKYLIGIAFLAGELAWVAYMLGASLFFISIGVTAFIGIGITIAVLRAQQKEKRKAEKYVSYWRKIS